MNNKLIKIVMVLIGLLDITIGTVLIYYSIRLTAAFRYYPLGPFIGIPLILIGIYIVWEGIESIRLKINAIKHNSIIYSRGLFASGLIGLFLAIVCRVEPLFKRLLFLFPAIICIFILIILAKLKTISK